MIPYVTFNEEEHSYHLSTTQERYISATQIKERFKRPYLGGFWTFYKAIQRFVEDNRGKSSWFPHKRNLRDLTYHPSNLFPLLDAHHRKRRFAPEELVKEWEEKAIEEVIQYIHQHFPGELPYIQQLQKIIKNEWEVNKNNACTKGTNYHLKQEVYAYETGRGEWGNGERSLPTAAAYSFDLKELPDGYYPELLLYNHQYKIAGQADRVWVETIDSIRFIDIDDYKTNKEIDTENKWSNFLYPINHLPETAYHGYALQISLYAWMLEQHGFVPRNLRFTHIKEDILGESQIPYNIPYLKKEVQDILEFYAVCTSHFQTSGSYSGNH